MKQKRVLITGACGTVGSALVDCLINQEDSKICLFDNNEEKLFWLSKRLSKHVNYNSLRFFLGDIRDKTRLMSALAGADVVYHCAALKHVRLNELNPFEAIKTNVLGVENVINAAISNKVSKVVFASSDKSVNPTSSMGASKLLGERLMIAANSVVGRQTTAFSCVRFGNILNSSGSVIPIFREQLQRNEALTITDPSMTRFVITMKSALDLMIFAESKMIGGEIFIANMGAAGIMDIARALNAGEMPNHKIIGAQAGEKPYEELVTDAEASRSFINGNYIVILPDGLADVMPHAAQAFEELYQTPADFPKGLKSDKDLMAWQKISELIN
jgi:UDP-N-acetylglucosamine 4,6-dehydratase/5-epimerase